eukprot:gene6097-8401_t
MENYDEKCVMGILDCYPTLDSELYDNMKDILELEQKEEEFKLYGAAVKSIEEEVMKHMSNYKSDLFPSFPKQSVHVTINKLLEFQGMELSEQHNMDDIIAELSPIIPSFRLHGSSMSYHELMMSCENQHNKIFELENINKINVDKIEEQAQELIEKDRTISFFENLEQSLAIELDLNNKNWMKTVEEKNKIIENQQNELIKLKDHMDNMKEKGNKIAYFEDLKEALEKCNEKDDIIKGQEQEILTLINKIKTMELELNCNKND